MYIMLLRSCSRLQTALRKNGNIINRTQVEKLCCLDRLYSTPSTKKTILPETTSSKTVYYGILTPQIKAVKIFSLSSSIVGLIAQPFLYNEIACTGNVPVIVAVYSCIGFFTFVTPVLLHFITKKYVTHLDYKADTDTYIAKTINFLCMSKQTEFKLKEVRVPEVPGMFTTLHAHGKPLFLDPKFFENPEHYAKLMGYDKPIDFKLYDANSTPSPIDNKNK